MDHVRPKSGQVQVEHGGEGVVHIRHRGGGWTVYIWGAMVWFPSDDNAGLGSRQVEGGPWLMSSTGQGPGSRQVPRQARG